MEEIQNTVNDSATAFIKGEKSLDTDFDAYITSLEDLNLDEVTEVKQAQYNRYLKALE